MRVLVTGWPSFRDGEATAGDVLSMRRVCEALASAGVAHDSAWSPVFRPGALSLDDADPQHYTHLVFACGPAHGAQVERLHSRYAACQRIAVGVSVLDADDPAVQGFHRVIPRDDGSQSEVDLSASATVGSVPVLGVAFAPGQPEYGSAGRHKEVHARLGEWLRGVDAATVPIDTRLDSRDWTKCATPEEFLSLVTRFDALVTTRLHGLVLGLRAGVPVLAVDPVAGGGKVQAQAGALGWPAMLSAADTAADTGDPAALDDWLRWCLSPEARHAAGVPSEKLTGELLAEVAR
jgi:hypothetical protein